MTYRYHANNIQTTLNGSINDSTTTVIVTSATGMPDISAGGTFHISLDDGTNKEIMQVTGVSTNTLTVVRGREGTSGHAFASGVIVMITCTADSVDRKMDRESFTTTATAAGTTTLVKTSDRVQVFTGTTTQTVKMPVTSTLALGFPFEIINLSTGVVTVQSSGSNTIVAMAANTRLVLTCIDTTVTTASGWTYGYLPHYTFLDPAKILVADKTSIATSSVTPVLSDKIILQDASASDAIKYATYQDIGNIKYNASYFQAYQSGSAQTVSHNTWTKVTLNSEGADLGSYFDNATNYRFTPLIAGNYLIFGQVATLTGGGFSGKRTQPAIYKNGSLFTIGPLIAQGADLSPYIPVSAIVPMNGSTDYIELYTYHNYGSDLTLITGSGSTFLQGVLM